MNSIRIVGNSVVIGGADIAPYAPYTNEPWSSEKWKGKKNPNEGWVQSAIEEALPIIQRVLSGKANDKDIKTAREKYQSIIEERKRLLIQIRMQKKEKIK